MVQSIIISLKLPLILTSARPRVPRLVRVAYFHSLAVVFRAHPRHLVLRFGMLWCCSSCDQQGIANYGSFIMENLLQTNVRLVSHSLSEFQKSQNVTKKHKQYVVAPKPCGTWVGGLVWLCRWLCSVCQRVVGGFPNFNCIMFQCCFSQISFRVGSSTRCQN